LRLALETLAELPEHLREEVKQALLARLVELDPAGTAEFVAHSSAAFPQEYFELWAKRDPESAIAWWKTLHLGGPFPAHSQIGYMLVKLATTEPARAARLLRENAATLDMHVVRDVFEKWAKVDSKAAMGEALALGNTAERTNAARAAVRGWMEQNPTEALAWFRQLTDAKLRDDVAAGVAIGLTNSDPAQSLEIVRSLPEGRVRDGALATLAEALFFQKDRRELFLEAVRDVPFDQGQPDVERLIRNWSFNDGAGFLRYALERFDSPAGDPAERRAIEGYLDKDSQLAFFRPHSDVAEALASSSVSPDAVRQRWLEEAVMWWSQRETEAARAWAEKQTAGPVRDRAFAGLAAGWAMNIPAETAQWIETLPVSSARQAAVGGFVRGAFSRDPAAALAWLHTLPAPDERLRVLRDGWQNWHNYDPISADQWRESAAELTAAERTALQAPR